MARKDHRFFRQREDFFSDAVEKQFPVAARKIPSPDSAAKKHVAADHFPPVGEIETQTPGAVTRDVEDLHPGPDNVAKRAFFQKAIGLKRLDIQAKPMASEKGRVRDHRSGVGMIGDPTALFPLDTSGVGGMVEVPVRQEQPVDFCTGEVVGRAQWSVKKKVSPGCFEEVGVRIEGAAGEHFELIHVEVV